MKSCVTIDEVIAVLNEMIALDKPATAALVANRVPCNEALADHPTILVNAQNGGFDVGLVGVLNGLFGPPDAQGGPICYEFEDGNLVRFTRRPTPTIDAPNG